MHFDAEDVVGVTVARVAGVGVAVRSGVTSALPAAEMVAALLPGMIEEFG